MGVSTSEPRLWRDAKAILGESLWWNADEGAMQWCDISAGVLHTAFAGVAGADAVGRDRAVRLPPPLASFQPITGSDGYIAALGDRVVLTDAAGAITRELARVQHPTDQMRFNEGKCDPFGDFVVGSMDLRAAGGEDFADGSLYRVRGDGSVQVLASGIGVANGFEWDEGWFYWTDTSVKTVYRARYGEELGEPEPFLVGHPSDGLTRDGDGGFWNGLYGEGAVIRWDAEGRVTQRIPLPAPHVTSVAFGGPDLSTLFVATAREMLTEQQLEEAPLSGSLFAIETSTRGFPVRSFGIQE